MSHCNDLTIVNEAAMRHDIAPPTGKRAPVRGQWRPQRSAVKPLVRREIPGYMVTAMVDPAGDGFAARSPQLPELTLTRPRRSDLMADLPSAVREAYARHHGADVLVIPLETPPGEPLRLLAIPREQAAGLFIQR